MSALNSSMTPPSVHAAPAAARAGSRASRRAAMSRKFFRIRWPCSEAMLSGWNCTPCTGSAPVRSAHDQAVVGLGGHRQRRRQRWRDRPPANGSASPGTGPLMPRNTPSPWCSISDSLPCIGTGARTTAAAERLADRLMAEADAEHRDCAAPPCPPGRGRCRPRSACRARAKARSRPDRRRSRRRAVILSLRCTTTSAPSSPR